MRTFILTFITILLWQYSAHAQLNVKPEANVRFIQSGVLLNAEKKAYTIGLHIKMTKGWKTYWKVPGDSGVPPHFEWEKSDNVKSVEVLWPAPEKLKDAYGTSIGYKDEVVFPIRLEIQDKSEPVDIKLKLAFGVCKEICILKDTVVETKIPYNGQSSLKDHVLLTKYLKRIPKKIGLKNKPENAEGMPFVVGVKADLKNTKNPYLLFKVAYPEASDNNALFVEVSDGFYMAHPKVKKNSKNKPNVMQYHVDLTKGDPVKELVGKTINLTMVSSIGQTETSWTIK